MRNIQGVFVDCDGVLYDADLLTYEQIVSAGRLAGVQLGLDWEDFDKVHQDLKKKGFHGFYNIVLELCQAQSIPFNSLAKKMTELLDYSTLQLNPELFTLLQQVSQKKKLFIFTNNTKPHLEKVFYRLFGCSVVQSGLSVITAESTFENGHFYPKRMHGVFAKWCQKLNLIPHQTLMLDDSDNVIDAAKKSGLQYYKIKSTQETTQILKELNETK